MNQSPENRRFLLIGATALCLYMLLISNMGISSGRFNTSSLTLGDRELNRTSRYTIRFTSINNQLLEEPILFENAQPYLSNTNLLFGIELINEWGVALRESDSQTAQSRQDELLDLFFIDIRSAEYDIIFMAANPVEKFSIEKFYSEELIESYQYPRTSHNQ